MCWPSGLPNMSRIFCRVNNLNRSFFCSAKMPQIGSSAAFAANGRPAFLPAAAQGFSPFQRLMRRDLILLKPVGSVRSHAAMPGPAARVSRKPEFRAKAWSTPSASSARQGHARLQNGKAIRHTSRPPAGTRYSPPIKCSSVTK